MTFNVPFVDFGSLFFDPCSLILALGSWFFVLDSNAFLHNNCYKSRLSFYTRFTGKIQYIEIGII